MVWVLVCASFAHAQTALPILPEHVRAEFPAVGRLGRAGFRERTTCTGTLIAPNLVLTAAHCVPEQGATGQVFAAGWDRGAFVAASAAARTIRHPAYALDGVHRPRNDVALVVLKEPLQGVTPIPVAQLRDGALDSTQVALVGYHRKTPHLLTGDLSCPVTQQAVGLVLVGCPVINGNSGGPLLRKTQAGWQVVGVVSSQVPGAALAAELSPWLLEAIATHQQ